MKPPKQVINLQGLDTEQALKAFECAVVMQIDDITKAAHDSILNVQCAATHVRQHLNVKKS